MGVRNGGGGTIIIFLAVIDVLLLLLVVVLKLEAAQLPVLSLIPCECWIFNRLAILLL